MSAANLYRYYEGKLAIGLAVNRELRSEWFAECDRAVQRSEPEVARALIALFHSSIDATRRQIKQAPLLFELGMTVARERPELRLEILAEMKRRIVALLAAGQQRGQIQAADPEQLAQLILLASAPFVLPWMLQTQPFGNPRAQVEPLMQCLVSGLKAVDSPRAAEAIT
jgi:AcrR family transcriptional regulator